MIPALNKDQISRWLDQLEKDREWLARKCGVSKGTVDQWFSRGFSDQALATIGLLMQKEGGAEDEAALISFNATEFEKIDKARRGLGYSSRPPFYSDAILDYVKNWEKSKTGSVLPFAVAAEDTYPPPITETRRDVRYGASLSDAKASASKEALAAARAYEKENQPPAAAAESAPENTAPPRLPRKKPAPEPEGTPRGNQ